MRKVFHPRRVVIPDDLTKPYFHRLGVEFSFNNMDIPRGTSMPYFHYHEVWEINLYQKGTKNCIIDGTLYELAPWDILLIPPGAVHRSFSPTNDPHHRTLMYLSEAYFARYADVIEKAGLLDNLKRLHLRPAASMRLPLARLMERITSMDVNELGDPVKNAMMQGCLFEFLVMLGSFPEAGSAPENETAARAMRFAEENYRNPITLADAARDAFVSPSYLSGLFKSCTGMNFTAYVQELRLRRAVTLLTETDDSISAIASACGFASPNYFKDVFRRVIGMPPTEYRRQAAPALEETVLEE